MGHEKVSFGMEECFTQGVLPAPISPPKTEPWDYGYIWRIAKNFLCPKFSMKSEQKVAPNQVYCSTFAASRFAARAYANGPLEGGGYFKVVKTLPTLMQ
jgi:hypothetical protein